MATETQKGMDNYVSHHFLIKFLVEKSLHNVSRMSWEDFINVDQFRHEQLQPRVLPQPRRASKILSMTEATPSASISSIGSNANPLVIEEETIDISSSETEHSERESYSFNFDGGVPLETLTRTREQKKEAGKRIGKAKT